MYKIYINETPLYLVSEESALPLLDLKAGNEKNLVLRHTGKKKFLLNVIAQMEASKRYEGVTVFSNDLPALWKDFKSIYKLIKAAGGLVVNPEGKELMIFRRGHWDLPKGKIDEGETPEEAAVREVQEETGLQNVHIERHLTDTYHTYEMGGKRILKKTYWYLMRTADTVLKPQHEEDIEEARWVGSSDNSLERKFYGNILDVMQVAQRLM